MSERTNIPNIDNHPFSVDNNRNRYVPSWFFSCNRNRAEEILLDSASKNNGNVLMRGALSHDGSRWKYVISSYREKKKDFLHYRILERRDGSLKLDVNEQHQPLASLIQAFDCFLELADKRKVQMKPVNLSKITGSLSRPTSEEFTNHGGPPRTRDMGSYLTMTGLNAPSYVILEPPYGSPPNLDLPNLDLPNLDYLTIEDNYHRSNNNNSSVGYENQALPHHNYSNVRPNGISEILPQNLSNESASNYLQPNQGAESSKTTNRSSDACIYHHLINSPSSPDSPMISNPSRGALSPTVSSEKRPALSPAPAANKRLPKAPEVKQASSENPTQQNIIQYEVPGNCSSIVKDDGEYATPHYYARVASENTSL